MQTIHIPDGFTVWILRRSPDDVDEAVAVQGERDNAGVDRSVEAPETRAETTAEK